MSLRVGRKIIALIATLWLCTFCNEPIKRYDFLYFNKLQGWESNKAANLHLDLRDSITKHTLYVCIQLYTNENLSGADSLPLNVVFISPDSTLYHDTIALPLNVIRNKNNYNKQGRMLELEWPYLKNISLNRCGLWGIKFSHINHNEPIYRNIQGIGVRYE